MSLKLYTSINPRMVRSALGDDVSDTYQRDCLRSWSDAGFTVVSLNNAKEIAEIARGYPDIETIRVEGERPFISDFIEAALRDDQAQAGFVNSDCLYIGDRAMADRIRSLTNKGLLLIERLNLDPDSFQTSGRCFGFDAFIFPTKYLMGLNMDESLRIGDAWWDYLFPLCFMRNGGKLYQTSPMIIHLNHVLGWNDANNLSGARIARSMFGGKFGLSQLERDDVATVENYAVEFFSFLRSKAEYVNLRGPTLPARMVDSLTLELRRYVDIEYNRAEVLRKAIKDYRLSRPSNRLVGECLCTASRAWRGLGLSPRVADWLWKAGEDLQYAAYNKPDA